MCKTILYNSHESFIWKKQLQREDITLQRLNWKRFIIFHIGVRIEGKNYTIETRKIKVNTCFSGLLCKDLSKVKPGFKSVPPQLYFEIAGLASTKKWRKIQNMIEEERY